LSIAAGMQFVMILQNRLLVIANQQRLLSVYILLGFIINVLGNFLFVPYLGIGGAAIARVCSNLFVYALSYRLINRVVHPFHLGTIWVRPLIAVIVMAGVVWLASGWMVIVRMILGTVAYGVVLLALGTFSREELLAWSHILRGKKNEEGITL